jgi:ArsR family transcriptional regulator
MMDVCGVQCIHQELLEAVEPKMPGPGALGDLANLFRLFGDSTKLSILWALGESEMCVCDLCALLKMKQPAVSHQLKNLRLARLVKSRREGKIVYYCLDDEHVRDLLRQGMAHVRET